MRALLKVLADQLDQLLVPTMPATLDKWEECSTTGHDCDTQSVELPRLKDGLIDLYVVDPLDDVGLHAQKPTDHVVAPRFQVFGRERIDVVRVLDLPNVIDMVEQSLALDEGVALGFADVFLLLGSHHNDTDVSDAECQSAFLGQYDPKHILSR